MLSDASCVDAQNAQRCSEEHDRCSSKVSIRVEYTCKSTEVLSEYYFAFNRLVYS